MGELGLTRLEVKALLHDEQFCAGLGAIANATVATNQEGALAVYKDPMGGIQISAPLLPTETLPVHLALPASVDVQPLTRDSSAGHIRTDLAAVIHSHPSPGHMAALDRLPSKDDLTHFFRMQEHNPGFIGGVLTVNDEFGKTLEKAGGINLFLWRVRNLARLTMTPVLETFSYQDTPINQKLRELHQASISYVDITLNRDSCLPVFGLNRLAAMTQTRQRVQAYRSWA